jgi:hypothetical protein
MFLQRKLSDALNALGEIPRKGYIREDPWIKQFTKDMLVKVASSKEAQPRDLKRRPINLMLSLFSP